MAPSSSPPTRYELESPINISSFHASHPYDPSRGHFEGLSAGIYGRDIDIPVPTPQTVDDAAHQEPATHMSGQGQRANHVGSDTITRDNLRSRRLLSPRDALMVNEGQLVVTRRFMHRRPALARVYRPPQQSAADLHSLVMQARTYGRVLPPWSEAYHNQARAETEERVMGIRPAELDRVLGDAARVTRPSRQEPTANGASRRMPGA